MSLSPPGDASFLDRARDRLSIDREGRFRYEDTPVTHPRVARLLWDHLTRDDDGRRIVRMGRVWSYVGVEDTVYVVDRIETEEADDGDGLCEVWLLLQDGSAEPLAPETLSIGAGGALYARVKGGAEEARFSRGAHFALGSRFEPGDDGRPRLTIGERTVAPGPREGA